MSAQTDSEVKSHSVPWWLVLIEGIAAIIIGILLFVNTEATIFLLVLFLGVYWLISGVFTLISLFWDQTAWGWKIFIGVVGILAGILVISHPLWSALVAPTVLVIVIGIFGIVIGVIQLMHAFKGAGWGIGILGALSILLGLLLLSKPVIASLAVPWVLGGLLVVGGILAIITAFVVRSARKEVKEAAVVAAPAKSEPVGVSPVAPGAVAGAAAGVVAAEALQAVSEEPAKEVEIASDAVLTGNVDLSDPTEGAKFKYDLEYVEGIGPVYAGKLKAIGMSTCLDLLRAGASRKGREEIAERSDISHTLILKWVNHVDLYRIKGVGSEYADLLEVAGVDTVVELAQRNPANLFKRMIEVNTEKDLVRRPPSDAEVEDWVAQAKGLPRVITY